IAVRAVSYNVLHQAALKPTSSRSQESPMSPAPAPFPPARLPSRAVLAVSGPEAKSFLDGLLTNDVERFTSASTLYAGLLSPQGKLLVDFLLVEQDGAVLIDVDRAQAPALAQRLALYKLRAKVEIAPRPDWEVAVVPAPAPGAVA